MTYKITINPWTPGDAGRFKKGLTDRQKRQWAEVANSALQRCLDEGKLERSECEASAIRQANGVVGNRVVLERIFSNAQEWRYEMWQGRQHLVAPVVMLVEGVHNGVMYPSEELAKYPEAWNGIPVPILHPKDEESGLPVSCNDPGIIERQSVGRLWNVRYDESDKKLRGEIWVDMEKAAKVDIDVVRAIQNRQPLEVSTGLWGDEENRDGNWGQEEYQAVLRNYRPDHLALLPGQVGACSWEDGCGVRANQGQDGGTMNDPKVNAVEEKVNAGASGTGGEDVGQGDEKREVWIKSLAKKLAVRFGLVNANEVSHEDIRKKLQEAVDGLDQPPEVMPATGHFVRDVFDDYVIIEQQNSEGASKLFRQQFSMNDDTGEVTLEGEPVEVMLKQEYVEVNESQPEPKSVEMVEVGRTETGNKKLMRADDPDLPAALENKEEEVTSEMKDKLIEQLMATGVFGEDDKEYLTGLEEDKLQAKLDALAAKAEPKVDDEGGDDKDSTPEPEAKHLEADPVANEAEPEGEPEVDRPKTAEEYLASSDMPDEFKEVLDSGLKMHREKKARLVKELSSNKRCKFTKDQLEAKGIEELEALAELANVPVDYTANSGKTKTPPTEPKANERQEDGTGVPEMPHEQWTADGRPDFSHLQ